MDAITSLEKRDIFTWFFSLCKFRHPCYRWEDSLNNTGRGSVTRSNSIPPSNPSRNSGRGRGRGRNVPHSATATFVSATGDPISGRRCFVCGDPSHFANACPNRGA